MHRDFSSDDLKLVTISKKEQQHFGMLECVFFQSLLSKAPGNLSTLSIITNLASEEMSQKPDCGGNEYFKSQNYLRALFSYSEAIEVHRLF